jgi:hypothetical protein
VAYTRGGQIVGNPVHTVQHESGTWATTIPVTLTATANNDTYRVAVIIEAGEHSDSATTTFTVR